MKWGRGKGEALPQGPVRVGPVQLDDELLPPVIHDIIRIPDPSQAILLFIADCRDRLTGDRGDLEPETVIAVTDILFPVPGEIGNQIFPVGCGPVPFLDEPDKGFPAEFLCYGKAC